MPIRSCLSQDCAALHLGSPLICWRSSNTKVHYPPRPKLDDEKHEQGSEEEVINWQEIASPDLVGMVVKEGGPVLIGLAF